MPSVIASVFLATNDLLLAQDAQTAAVIATEGAGPLGLGALVGALVAGGFAIRERFRGE